MLAAASARVDDEGDGGGGIFDALQHGLGRKGRRQLSITAPERISLQGAANKLVRWQT